MWRRRQQQAATRASSPLQNPIFNITRTVRGSLGFAAGAA
jgi:hypothetical protein